MAKIQTLDVGDTILSTNIDSLQFVTTIPQEFEFSIVAGSNAGVTVVGASEFDNPDAIEKLEYYEVNDSSWHEFSGDFGGSLGFPLTDATSKFRVTFKTAGDYTFEAYVKKTEDQSKVATCTATAHVREYKKVELSSTFADGEGKVNTPYDFSITFTPGDDVSKSVSGKLEMSLEGKLEKKGEGGDYEVTNGIFETVILEEETNEFRYTPSSFGQATMTFTLTDNEEEYVKLEQEMTVADKVKAEVEITAPDSFEEHQQEEIVINVTANDEAGENKTFKYVFSVPEAVEHIEQYVTDEDSEFSNQWMVVDPSNIGTIGELRTISDEEIRFRVTFMQYGDYTLKVMVDDVEAAESIISVKEPEDPVEPVETVEITVIEQPEGSNVDIVEESGSIKFVYPKEMDNDFWVNYYQSSTTDGTANAYMGIRFTAPEDATHYQIISQGPESSDDTTVTEIENPYVDWYFAIAKSDNEESPTEGTFSVLDTESTGTTYQLTVKFFKNNETKSPTEIYSKEFNITLSLEEEEEVPQTPEEIFERVIRYALSGYTNHDCIVLYGNLSGWTSEQIKDAITKYNNDFGKFCLDYGHITTELEKALINYCTHYTLIDSVVKFGIIDMEQTRNDFDDMIQAVPHGISEVLKALQSSGTTMVPATPDADLNKPDENLIITASEEPITGKKTINGKSIVVKSMNTDSSSVSMVSTGNVSIKNYSATGELKKSVANAQLKINTSGDVAISSSSMGMKGYNCVEIGLNASELPEKINISDIDFSGELSNNAILIFGTENNAVINVDNCHFKKLSNAIRMSNKTNATGVTLNINNCKFDEWESSPEYAGFLMFQDYTSGSAEAEEENNLFSQSKITVNVVNCYGPDGKKITADNLADVCGTGKDGQLVYVYCNKSGVIPYGDGSRYPKITFK